MDWSDQQKDAIERVSAWHKAGDQQVLRVFGYAGTGKTTLARHFADSVDGRTQFAAFTGKAAIVMRKNGCHGASTIHRLIYRAETDEETGEAMFKLDSNGTAKDAALIVVDECSMVDEAIGKDLMSFGVPILVLGDPAQLPPVSGGGFFTAAEPDIMLTQIHRQAESNPIVHLATQVRRGEMPDYGSYGQSAVIPKSEIDSTRVMEADQILVGTNRSRHAYNMRLRELLGHEDALPVEGDRVVCIRNDRTKKIFNGGLFDVVRSHTHPEKEDCLRLTLASEDFPTRSALTVTVREEFFSGGAEEIDWKEIRGQQQFNYGYALTVHKAQGSQWNDVVLFDESRVFREDRMRWLYTGITRASERITVVR
ncbi:MAG: AAA family ATPase [Litorimonas sp.]